LLSGGSNANIHSEICASTAICAASTSGILINRLPC
jgi:hypothetical protein